MAIDSLIMFRCDAPGGRLGKAGKRYGMIHRIGEVSGDYMEYLLTYRRAAAKERQGW